MGVNLSKVKLHDPVAEHYDVDAILRMDRETIRKTKSYDELKVMLQTMQQAFEEEKRAWQLRHREALQESQQQDNKKSVQTTVFGIAMPWLVRACQTKGIA